MQIFLGADHRGFELKNRIVNWLQSQSIPCTDFGAVSYDAEDDYNDYAKQVAHAVLDHREPGAFGILVCGSAQGVAMQANRYKGIRAAICHSPAEAVETRGHNDANILCISADQHMDDFAEIISSFLQSSPIENPKYQRRNQKLDED
ncbi:RpiB/LacA/LacB family sugar-phosphate isomerase [Candidatus Saccharibacteria bacterium]|nr:RpiB/LacA/LacB family sugar-phosphate isomerase [Candidatus Saccharibacteria bacterium]